MAESLLSWQVPITGAAAPSWAPAVVVAPPTWQRVALNMQWQSELWWCWAAVAASVAEYFSPSNAWRQCQVAGATLGNGGCCANPSPCNQQYDLDKALTAVGHFSGLVASTVSAGALAGELTAGRPIGSRVNWSGGGGHFVAIAGLLQGSQDYIGITDPWYGPSDVTFAAFCGSYQSNGSWDATYLVC